MLVLPDAEPFDQILGALKFGMKTILLPFEPRHILHRHTERGKEEERERKINVQKLLKTLKFIHSLLNMFYSSKNNNNMH